LTRRALFTPAPPLTRLLRALLALAALMIIAHWISRLTAPGPVAALPVAPMAAGAPSVKSLLRLFGGGERGVRQDEPVLTGVFAHSGGRGFATFRVGHDSRFAFIGDEIQPGVWLIAIQPDHVIVSERGVERRIMPAKKALMDTDFVRASSIPGEETDHGQ